MESNLPIFGLMLAFGLVAAPYLVSDAMRGDAWVRTSESLCGGQAAHCVSPEAASA